MKNLHLLILALLVGCTKQFSEDDNMLIITAFSADFDTKANETAFEAGDKIGIFLESNHGNNALYETTDGSTWRGYDNIYKVNAGEKARAYYPYSENATNLSAIEVAKNVDFMITSATPIALDNNKASVALQFKHVLSKLTVDIQMPEEIAGVKTVSLDSVVVKNVFRKGTINLADGKISGLTDKGDLKAFGNEIIVIPQTAQKIKLVFKMVNGAFDSLAYNTPITFETGKKTTLNAVSNADLYFTSTINLSSGEAQTDLPLSLYVAPGRTWTLKSSEPWLTFSATTGIGAATVKVNVAANTAFPRKARTADLVLADDKNAKSNLYVMQNYAKIALVNIAGTNWTTTNLTGPAGQVATSANIGLCQNPQDYGTCFKWGDKWVYQRASSSNDGAAGGGNGMMGNAAVYPQAGGGNLGYDYALGLSGGRASGDPCKLLGAYRTMTQGQWVALRDSGTKWGSYKDVNGRFFGANVALCDNQTIAQGCIFMSAGGGRSWNDGSLQSVGARGQYWTSSVWDSTTAWMVVFDINSLQNAGGAGYRGGLVSVRCVAE